MAGGGPAGVAAALVAARAGKSVFLAEGEACFGGMGTSGLVGPIMTFQTMTDPQTIAQDPWTALLYIALLEFVFPAILAIFFSEIMRKLGWIRKGDMKLPD